eukprot:11850697-Heterocapsa_arctica.AAC.1
MDPRVSAGECKRLRGIKNPQGPSHFHLRGGPTKHRGSEREGPEHQNTRHKRSRRTPKGRIPREEIN